MTTAIFAQGTHIQYETSPGSGVYTTVSHAKGDLEGPQVKREVLDVTDHDSPSGYKEKLGTLIDPGTVKFTVNYLPTDVTHQHMIALAQSGAIINWRYLMVDVGASFFDFAGFVSVFGPPKGPVSGVYEAPFEITVTGAVTPPA